VTRTGHVATFIDDVLDECTDVEIASTVPPELPEWEPPEPPLPASSDNRTRIARPCGEQFSGRTVLATCSATLSDAEPDEDGVTSRATLNSRYYRFATALENDHFMRTCMTAGGNWWAVADDSTEYTRARLDFHTRELERASKSLGGRRR